MSGRSLALGQEQAENVARLAGERADAGRSALDSLPSSADTSATSVLRPPSRPRAHENVITHVISPGSGPAGVFRR